MAVLLVRLWTCRLLNLRLVPLFEVWFTLEAWISYFLHRASIPPFPNQACPYPHHRKAASHFH